MRSFSFSRKHLLGLEDLTAEEIMNIIETAEAMKEIAHRDIKKVPTLRGKTIALLFFEPSTRTRVSFEIAAKWLSADTVTLTTSGSSVAKGETFLDTVRNIEAMKPDAIVVRHSVSGFPHFISKKVKVPVINAGDGTHEHPTQALLDLLTVKEKKGRVDGLTVTIIGDITHSRVARSDIYAFTKMGSEVRVAGPMTMIPPGIERMGAKVFYNVKEAIRGSDVIIVLRLQLERQKGLFFSTLREYSKFFGLNPSLLSEAKEDVIIMHPGPINRGVEISTEVADGPYSVILDQVTNGIAIRMAVLYLLCTGGKFEVIN